MLITKKLYSELTDLKNNIDLLLQNKNVNDIQIESFLRNLEKRRYNILNEIKIYNKTVDLKTERISNVSDDYAAEARGNVLKIYIPEVMPSYKNINLKTHAYKNILLNIKEKTEKFAGMFEDKVFIYIKIFDNIKGWDIDNKFIKPIPDALIASKVIKDDNFEKLFYCLKGEYSDNPHTEVYVFNDNVKIDINSISI